MDLIKYLIFVNSTKTNLFIHYYNHLFYFLFFCISAIALTSKTADLMRVTFKSVIGIEKVGDLIQQQRIFYSNVILEIVCFQNK